LALRMRVSMSAMLSLVMDHHELFWTPGICPMLASWRKQIRHMPNLRI
jgi:hypothetical protein